MPAYGHVNPTLAIAQELVKRGQEVIYYVSEPFREAAQATGATVRCYDSKLNTIESIGPGVFSKFSEEAHHVLPQALEFLRDDTPDIIIYEPFGVWPRIAVSVLQIPAIALRPTYAMNEHFNMAQFAAFMRNQQRFPNMPEMMERARANIAELCAQYNVPPFDPISSFIYAEPLTIVFLPKAFQPAADSFDERFVFVGPSILTRHEATDFPLERLDSERPLLYISLGTVANNQPEFFKHCLEAFGGSNYQVVLSRGRRVDPEALGPVPDNFLVSAYVPQLEILPRTSVFITHGGMNSTMESLYYGVPMVVIPQMGDQFATGQRVAELGLGLMLNKEAIDVTALREAVERVANEPAFRERAQQMQQSTRDAGGYQRAADAIMQFTQEHGRQVVG
jgi:MGT family glycosyltransferase